MKKPLEAIYANLPIICVMATCMAYGAFNVVLVMADDGTPPEWIIAAWMIVTAIYALVIIGIWPDITPAPQSSSQRTVKTSVTYEYAKRYLIRHDLYEDLIRLDELHNKGEEASLWINGVSAVVLPSIEA